MRTLAIAILSIAVSASASPALADEPAIDEPAIDEPATDEPAAAEPAADEPATDEPATDEPSTAEAEPVAEPAPAASVGYKGGFFIKDGVNSLTIQGRVQPRFTYEMPDGGDDEHNFSIARARLTLKGNAFDKNFAYKFQTDFGKGGVVLKDFLVDYQLGGDGPRIRVGQWKRPFSRQQITSSGKLHLVDRAITDKAFGAGRDIGIAVHNDYEKSPELEWVVGVFNGTGDKPWFDGDVAVDPATGEGEVTGGKFTNVPAAMHPALVARVGYNANGIKGYSEADLEGGALRYGVGASVLADFDADGGDDGNVRAELDYIVKANGLSSSGGVYVATAQDGEGFADQSFAALGLHTELGYMLQGRYQPAVRYAMVAPDGDDNNQHEITGGLSVYKHGHSFKWQADVGALISETAGDSTTDLLARTQLELSW